MAIRDVIKHIRNRSNLKEFDEVKLSGENIGNTLLEVLAELEINTTSCVGQGYDGSSVMSSERVGTALSRRFATLQTIIIVFCTS